MSALDEVERREAAARHRPVMVDGRRTAWRIWGEGPPLVLLHGDFGSWTHWIRNVLPLSARFTVIVPDMPGYGDSDPPPADWTPERLAGDLAAGLRGILSAAESYGLAGFSFGGIIAGHLAALEGERVDRLLLIGPGGLALPGATPGPLRRLAQGMDPGAVRDVHRHNLAMLMIADEGKVDHLAVHLQIENARRSRIRAGTIPDGDTLLEVLPTIRARIHGLWGARDAMFGPHIPAYEALLRRCRPELEFHTVEGAGHWVPYECPEAVNAILTRLMQTPPRRASPRSGAFDLPR